MWRYNKQNLTMSIYMVLNSDENLNIFPNNMTYRFRAKLQAPLLLKGTWVVALIDIKTTCDIKIPPSQLYVYSVYSDICGDSIVDGVQRPLLRRILINKGIVNKDFNSLWYVPVKFSEIRDIEIYINDKHNQCPSFLKDPLTLTLHFKSYPFIP